MDASVEQVKKLAATVGEEGRRKLIVSLHELAYELEDSNDTVHRFGYLVRYATASPEIPFILPIT